MIHPEAEAAFATLMRIPQASNAASNRDVLRDTLVRHRAAVDSGLDMRTLHKKGVARQRNQEKHAHAAVVLGVGSASGMMSAAEMLFGDPLPPCDRWDQAVAPHLAGPTAHMLHKHETLGYEGRPSLPHAANVPSGERSGPHGTLNVQMRMQPLPCVSYSDLQRNVLSATFGNILVDYGIALHAGVAVERIDEARSERDIRAEQQDGVRQWPPRALQESRRGAVTDMVNALAKAAEEGLPSPSKGRRGLGTAGVHMYWRACIAQLTSTEWTSEGMRDFRALGVCAYARDNAVLRELQQRALTLAVVAHQQGASELGRALERLSTVLVSCNWV